MTSVEGHIITKTIMQKTTAAAHDHMRYFFRMIDHVGNPIVHIIKKRTSDGVLLF